MFDFDWWLRGICQTGGAKYLKVFYILCKLCLNLRVKIRVFDGPFSVRLSLCRSEWGSTRDQSWQVSCGTRCRGTACLETVWTQPLVWKVMGFPTKCISAPRPTGDHLFMPLFAPSSPRRYRVPLSHQMRAVYFQPHLQRTLWQTINIVEPLPWDNFSSQRTCGPVQELTNYSHGLLSQPLLVFVSKVLFIPAGIFMCILSMAAFMLSQQRCRCDRDCSP